jgi:hypothetical protein
MRRTLGLLLGVLGIAAAAFGEGPPEQRAEAIATQKVNFNAGGTIRWSKSWGDLYIEGWDQPQIEITVRKFTSYSDHPAQLKEKAPPKLESISIADQRQSDSEMVISTMWAQRKDWAPPLSKSTKNGVHLEYRVYVPRNSHLVIDHRGGSVEIGNVTGDIEAANKDGDILVMVPASGKYAIEARSKMGHIASDFEGHTLSRYLVGQRFVGGDPAGAKRLQLRTGFGGITILAIPPEGEGLSSEGDE